MLITLFLTAHLLCVDVAAAGPLASIWLEWREGRGDSSAGRIGRRLAALSLGMLVAGTTLGVGVGVLHWNDAYVAILKSASSKVYYGVWEILFSLVLMSAHWFWWRARPATSTPGRMLRMTLPLLSGTNLLYHFTFLFIVIADVDAGFLQTPDKIDAPAFRSLMAEPQVYIRALHVALASLAVTGIAVMWLAARTPLPKSAERSDVDKSPRGEPESDAAGRAAKLDRQMQEDDRCWVVWGARLALIPTLLQVLVGFWFMTHLPRPAMSKLMGGDPLATGLFVAAIAAAIFLMQQLSAPAFGDVNARTVPKCVAAMGLTVLLMTATLERTMPSGVLREATSAPQSSSRTSSRTDASVNRPQTSAHGFISNDSIPSLPFGTSLS